jgi:signal transduction histidine kinase
MLEESARIIEDEVGSLIKLVREFSDFARMPEFKPLEQDLGEMLIALEKLYGDRLQPDIPQHLPTVTYDYEYLKRALINLVDNALAASAENDPVRLQVKTAAEKIYIIVADHGCGIAEENISKIFEPYFSTKRSGVGLGLAIVKKIIEEHGGSISVDSTPGHGTTFIIELALPNAEKARLHE